MTDSHLSSSLQDHQSKTSPTPFVFAFQLSYDFSFSQQRGPSTQIKNPISSEKKNYDQRWPIASFYYPCWLLFLISCLIRTSNLPRPADFSLEVINLWPHNESTLLAWRLHLFYGPEATTGWQGSGMVAGHPYQLFEKFISGRKINFNRKYSSVTIHLVEFLHLLSEMFSCFHASSWSSSVWLRLNVLIT